MKIKLHPLSNGRKHGWGRGRALFDFFFPYIRDGRDQFIRQESSASWVGERLTKRHFYTFRAFFWHYFNQYLIYPITNWQKNAEEWAKELGLNPKYALQIGAIATDTHAKTDAGTTLGGSTGTYSYTVTGASPLLLFFPFSNAGDFLTGGVTFNSVSMSQLIKRAQGTTASQLYIFGLVGQSGTHNIVDTFSTTGKYTESAAASFSGVKQTGLPDSSNSSGAASGNGTLSVTSSADNCFIVGCGRASTGTNTVGTNTTKLDDTQGVNTGLISFVYSSNPKTPPGSVTLNMTNSVSTDWGMLGVSFAPALAKGNFLFLMN